MLMNMRDFPTLHLDINSSKGIMLLLLFCQHFTVISVRLSQSDTYVLIHLLFCFFRRTLKCK